MVSGQKINIDFDQLTKKSYINSNLPIWIITKEGNIYEGNSRKTHINIAVENNLSYEDQQELTRVWVDSDGSLCFIPSAMTSYIINSNQIDSLISIANEYNLKTVLGETGSDRIDGSIEELFNLKQASYKDPIEGLEWESREEYLQANEIPEISDYPVDSEGYPLSMGYVSSSESLFSHSTHESISLFLEHPDDPTVCAAYVKEPDNYGGYIIELYCENDYDTPPPELIEKLLSLGIRQILWYNNDRELIPYNLTQNKTASTLRNYNNKEFSIQYGSPEPNSTFLIHRNRCYWWSLEEDLDAKDGFIQLIGDPYAADSEYRSGDVIYGEYKSSGDLRAVMVKAYNRDPSEEEIMGVLKFFDDLIRFFWNYKEFNIQGIKAQKPFIFVIAPDGRIARRDYAGAGQAYHAELAKSLGAYSSEDEVDRAGYGYVRGIVGEISGEQTFFAAPGIMAPFSEEQKAAIMQIVSEINMDQIKDIMVEDSRREYTLEDLYNMPEDEPLVEPVFDFQIGDTVRLEGSTKHDQFYGEIATVLLVDERNQRYTIMMDNEYVSSGVTVETIELEDQNIMSYYGDSEISNRHMEKWNNRDYNTAHYGSVLSPVQDQLAEVIWDGDILKEEVKDFCFEKVAELLEAFMDQDEIPVLLKRVIMIGSITGYQYDPDADLDVNVLVDLDTLSENMGLDKELLIYEMRGKVGEINGDNFPGTEHPVNLFLSTQEGYPPADGIYDMVTGEWIKKPGHPGNIDPYANLKESIDRAEEVAAKVDAKWGAANRTYQQMQKYPSSGVQIKRQLTRYLKSLVRIMDNVVSERREVFETAREQGIDPPQSATPNIVYKYLEINGLLDKLHQADHILEAFEESGELNFGMEILSKGSRSFTEAQRYRNRGRLPERNSEALESKIGNING